MGMIAHYIDNEWVLQKRILIFRVFDQSHTADNINMMLKTVFEEYKIDNKIFTIGFDNASNNTVVITQLITLCNSYFSGQFFLSKLCIPCFKFMYSKWLNFTTRSYYVY